MPQANSPELTFLQNADQTPAPQRKSFTAAGPSEIKSGYKWRAHDRAIPDFDTLARVLDEMQRDPLTIAILGQVAPDHRHRDLIERQKKIHGDNLTPPLIDAPSHFLHFDADDLTIPQGHGWHDPAALASWSWSKIVASLPPLAGVSVWWQASGSAGVAGKDRAAKFHFWVMLDSPLVHDQRKSILKGSKAQGTGVDPAVACPIQKQFIAAPHFDGIPDPLDGRARSGVIIAAHDRAHADDLVALFPPKLKPTRPARPQKATGRPEAQPSATGKGTTQAGEIALQRAENAIRGADQRNVEINRQSYFIGRRIAAGQINEPEAFGRLESAGFQVGHDRTEQAVENGIRDGIAAGPPDDAGSPARVVFDTKAGELWDRRTATLIEALKGVRSLDDLPIVIAVALAMAQRAPAQIDADGINTFLSDHIPAGALPADWRNAVMQRVRWALDKRRGRALAPLRISRQAAVTVDRVRVDQLDPADVLIEGVTIVRAPLGSGKTQRVAAPWIAAARDQGGRVMAICHRVSLVEELSRRLGLASYRATDARAKAIEAGGLAICLPSITLRAWQGQRPDVLFVDEIEQVLAFLNAPLVCRTKDGNARRVYDRLVELVRGAKAVLVADATASDRTIAFLQHCRPGDTIRVVEMPEAADAGIRADVIAGSKDAYAQAVDEAARELALGRKVWIATEGAAQAADVATYLRRIEGVRVLDLTAESKLRPDQAAFLMNPEQESRRWDCVVASPVVASGISIEHKGDPHFDLGVYLGAGHCVTPADAAQQLRRVRYLDRFIIALAQNNLTAGRDAAALIAGREIAAQDEGVPIKAGDFDRLVSGIEADARNARADFAAGLWWLLEAQGWTLKRRDLTEAKMTRLVMEAHRSRRDEEHATALVEASKRLKDTTVTAIEDIRRSGPVDADRDLVEAWDICGELGVATLTIEDVAFWDGGRGRAMLDRFDDMRGIGPQEPGIRDRRAVLAHRSLRLARRRHFAEIFEGFDIFSEEPWLTKGAADQIVDRVMKRSAAYAASGAVPDRYAPRYGQAAPARPRDSVKVVVEIVRRAGVKMVAKQRRVSHIGPNLFTEWGVMCDSKAPQEAEADTRQKSSVERVRAVDPASLSDLKARSMTRRYAADLRHHPAHQIEDEPRRRSRPAHQKSGKYIPHAPESFDLVAHRATIRALAVKMVARGLVPEPQRAFAPP